MINRVQAFNNKNDYRQNFGMAFVKGTGRNKFNALVRTMGTEPKVAIEKRVAEITAARQGDKHVDIMVKEANKGNHGTFIIGVFEKGKEKLATIDDQSICHLFGTRGIEAGELTSVLDEVNNFAAKAEQIYDSRL